MVSFCASTQKYAASSQIHCRSCNDGLIWRAADIGGSESNAQRRDDLMGSRGETGSVAVLLLVEYCDEIFPPLRAFAQRVGVFLSWMGIGRFRPWCKFCRRDRHSMDARVAGGHSRPITVGAAHSFSVPFREPFPARPRKLEEKIGAPSSPMRPNHLGHSRVESSYRSGPGPAPPSRSDIGEASIERRECVSV